MRSRVPLLFAALAISVIVTPLVTHASIPFFGPIIGSAVPGKTNWCPLGWASVIIVINNIISFGLTMAIVFVAPIMIAYSGFLYVVNPMNPTGLGNAKQILTNTITGIVIALAAWMIVDAIMAVLYNQKEMGSVWSELVVGNAADTCLTQKGALPDDSLSQVDPSAINVTPLPGTGGIVGGACTAPSSGPCSLASLQSTCFASNADMAGQICSKESSGNPNNLSSSDVTADGYKYSVGLFQINITNSFSQKVNGQSCSSAFTVPCQGSAVIQSGSNAGKCSATLKDPALYAACVAAAQDPTKNITEACRLSGNGYVWGAWRNTALSCNLILR